MYKLVRNFSGFLGKVQPFVKTSFCLAFIYPSIVYKTKHTDLYESQVMLI